MTRTIQILHIGFLLLMGVLIAYVIFAVQEVRAVESHVGSFLAESEKSVLLLRQHTDRVLTEAGLTAASLRKTALEAEKASVEQRKYWAQSSEQITVVIENLNAAILHTDESVNQKVLPATVLAIEDTHQIAQAAAKSIEDTNAGLKPVLENAALMSSNAAKLMADPAITEALAHINESTAHIEQVSESVEATAKSLELYARRITKPASLAVRALTTVGTVLGSFGAFLRNIL